MEINSIYCGDCNDILKKFPDESVDLIYLDPPFFSQKDYENFWIKDKVSRFKFTDKQWNKLRKSINSNILKQYEDIEKRWKGGHKGIYVYIAYMRERLEQCWRVLKSTGSIYLHCDWHAGHYLKEMIDGVFGYNNFRNEIVWCYTRPGTKHQTQFPRVHDTIFWYSKSDVWTFNPDSIRIPYSKKTLERGKYSIATSKVTKGIDKRVLPKGGKVPEDWWQIPMIQGNAKERMDYPTQKPERLLTRIVEVSSNKGGLVLDPFCGCGTTIVVAKRLKRNFIGIDISRTACDVMKKRIKGDVKVIGGESENELKKMDFHEFARLIIVEKLNGTINPKKSGDFGIDGWTEFRTIPVQVKRWGHKVCRPEIDKFKTAIERDHKIKGLVVAFDFSSGCWNEVERIKKEHKIEIQLKTVKEIFNQNNKK